MKLPKYSKIKKNVKKVVKQVVKAARDFTACCLMVGATAYYYGYCL